MCVQLHFQIELKLLKNAVKVHMTNIGFTQTDYPIKE